MERICRDRNETENEDVGAHRRLPIHYEDPEQDEHEQFPNIKIEREHDERREDEIDEYSRRRKPELERTGKE
jgi:hypothetical protein